MIGLLFQNPVQLSSQTLWMVVPVCVAVAAVYKTLRTRALTRLPLEILLLSLYMLLGVAGLVAGFWLIVISWHP